MPEKYQKNTKSQHNPAQSKPVGDVLPRLKIAIKRSSTLTRENTGGTEPASYLFHPKIGRIEKGKEYT